MPESLLWCGSSLPIKDSSFLIADRYAENDGENGRACCHLCSVPLLMVMLPLLAQLLKVFALSFALRTLNSTGLVQLVGISGIVSMGRRRLAVGGNC